VALSQTQTRAGAVACLPAEAVGEARIVQTWLSSHDAAALDLDPVPDGEALERFAGRPVRPSRSGAQPGLRADRRPPVS